MGRTKDTSGGREVRWDETDTGHRVVVLVVNNGGPRPRGIIRQTREDDDRNSSGHNISKGRRRTPHRRYDADRLMVAAVPLGGEATRKRW
jgi:hypothetical protein